MDVDGWCISLCMSVYVCMSACVCFYVLCVLINNVFMPVSMCFLCWHASVCVCTCACVFWYVMPFVLCVFLCVGCAAHPVAVPVAGTAPGLDPYQHAPAQTE